MKQIIINNISTHYYITQDGKCYNSITNKYLKGQYNYKNQYLSYNLTLPDGTEKRFYAHRLVANAYLAPTHNPKATYVNHKDGDKTNNCVDNLEWCTSSENKIHAIKMELQPQKHVFCFNKEKVLVAEYLNATEAANAIKIGVNLIYQEIHKEKKALCGNFYWSYTKDNNFETVYYKNTGKAKQVYQYTIEGKFINCYSSCGQAARSLGLSTSSHIAECCRGKIKTYKGFVWRYSEDIVSPFDESQRDTSEVS